MDFYKLPLPDFDKCIYYINDFVLHQLIRGLSKSTLDLYTREATSFLSIISPSQITKRYIQDYIVSFDNISPAGKNMKITSIRIILKYLYNQGFSNCDIKLHNFKNVSKFPDFISIDDMKIQIKHFQLIKNKNVSIWKGKRDYALLLFMYATGLRASEICRFKLSDLDAKTKFIRVENGKGSKDRYVPIAVKAIKALEELYKYMPNHFKSLDTPLFLSNGLNYFNKTTLYIFCKKKYKYNPHTFRHTFATHLISNGCDVSVLSDFLGHESLITTQIYTHIQKSHLKDTVNNHFPKMI